MMKFKCFVILGLFVSVQSASIYSKPIDIPVEVVYSEEIPYETHYIAPPPSSVSRRNLNEKIQLSPTELRQLSKAEENRYDGNLNSLKNLDAKIQLSSEDLLQVDKHLPLINSQELQDDFKVNSVEENSNANAAANQESDANLEQNKPLLSSVKPTESNKPSEEVFESLGEASTEKLTSTEQPAPASSTTEENLPDPNIVLLIQLAQNIVSSGLTDIRENIDNLGTDEENSNKNPAISSQQWDRLNRTITNFFSSLLERGTFKGTRENALQVIVTGVRKVTNNFVESLRSEASNATQATQAPPPQQPGVAQSIINLITSGFQGITASLNNIRNRSTTASTVLGENDQATTVPPGPFQNIVNQFGQIGEAINNLNPFTSTAAPESQGDEGSTAGNPFQNFANQVGQVISGLNPLNQLSTAAPGAQGPTAAPGAQNEGTTQGGPLQAVQSVFNQVGQAVNNIFNQGVTVAPGAQNEEGSTPAGPLQQAFQNVVNVIGNLNPLNPTSTPPPGSQSEGETSSGPLQGLINQVGQAISGLNPLNQASTAAPGNKPLDGVQNAINQVGQVASTFNPLNQGSTSAPGSNPLEGVQNAINQIGQAASSLNPLSPGSTVAPGTNLLEGVQNAVSQVGQALSTLAPNPAPAADAVESVQSGQKISSGETSNPEEKVKDSSEQEIMVAID